MNPTPRRHSFDDKMLTLLDSPFEVRTRDKPKADTTKEIFAELS